MSGTKGHSGRKPVFKQALKRAHAQLDIHIDAIMQAAIKKALGGYWPAQEFLIQWRYGRPIQMVDQRITAEISLTADDYAALARAQLIEQRILRLDAPTDDVVDAETGALGEDELANPAALEGKTTPAASSDETEEDDGEVVVDSAW